MNSNERGMIIKVCSDVFEQLAFLFAEEIDMDEADANTNEFYQAFMTFKGEKKGSVDMIVPIELTQSLAYNILGIEPADGLPPGTAEDALKEMLNTICGRILTCLYGDTAVFDLSVPHTKALNLDEYRGFIEKSEHIALDVECNPVLFRMICE